jgi:hypothetical protein
MLTHLPAILGKLRAARLLLAPLAALILSGCQADEPRPKLPRGSASLLEVDFRKTKLDETKLKPSFAEAFDFCESRPEGLRIALADDVAKPKETGVLIPFPIQGDFEVTTAYEQLSVGADWGASIEIYLQTASPTKEALAFNRVLRQGDMGEYFVTRLTTNDLGKRVDAPGDFKRTTAVRPRGTTGELRIARKGTMAILSAHDFEPGFEELFQVPLGSEDVIRLRIGLNPRRVKPVEVRLLDLRITGAAPAVVEEQPPPPRRLWFWLAIGLFTFALALGGLMKWCRKRRPAQPPGTVPDSTPDTRSAPA